MPQLPTALADKGANMGANGGSKASVMDLTIDSPRRSSHKARSPDLRGHHRSSRPPSSDSEMERRKARKEELIYKTLRKMKQGTDQSVNDYLSNAYSVFQRSKDRSDPITEYQLIQLCIDGLRFSPTVPSTAACLLPFV